MLKYSGGSKGGRKGRAPPWAQILSISCSFWENLAKSYVGAPPGELAPPPRGNPGSATETYGKSAVCMAQADDKLMPAKHKVVLSN